MRKRLLLVKAGDVQPPLRTSHGDYDRWFQRALGAPLFVVQAHRRERLPRVADFDMVIMTGSPSSVTRFEPWMAEAADYLLDAAEHRRPVLGVCFGQQLLAHRLGGTVIRNPNGSEFGTVEVRLTPAGCTDPLLEDIPDTLAVQATHGDVVDRPPAGAVALAGNANTPFQAMSFGDRIRGVQFHPELDAATMSGLIRARIPTERAAPILAGVRSTPWAEHVLRNFVAHF